MVKSIIYAGTFTSSVAGLQTFLPTSNLGSSVVDYNSMDVILNVRTLTGSGVSTQPSVREQFSDIGYVETGNYGKTINAAGVYIISHDGQSGQTGTSNIQYGFGMQGKGINKEIVFNNSSVTAMSTDVYFQFYGGGS